MFWRLIPILVFALIGLAACSSEHRPVADDDDLLVDEGGGEYAVDADIGPWRFIDMREVNYQGKIDHDRIVVGASAGAFTYPLFKVNNDDIKLYDVTITRGSGDKLLLSPAQLVETSARTHVIRLPATEFITSVDFHYRNMLPGGNAVVELWGR
ncbi:MAG: hypothetical protein IT462_17335 [Planctomycetes bacterium]|nr:hypothetical protein [Planctomycetota bacterium]